MQPLLHILWVTGLRLRCPVCEQGKLFHSYFNLNKTCPHCAVRFERKTGEEAGGMSLSIVVLGIIFLIAYPLIEFLTDWSLWTHLAIWLPFSILFPIFFYPYSRSLWIVFLYLTGSVHQDPATYRDTDLTFMDALRNQKEDDIPKDGEK